jgi:hypothetical protein
MQKNAPDLTQVDATRRYVGQYLGFELMLHKSMLRYVCLAPLAVLAISGCHHPTVVGKWKVDPDFVKAHQNDPPEGYLIGFSSTFKYELKSDNTFTGSMSGGTYTVDGNNLVMTTTQLLGKDISAQVKSAGSQALMTGELSDDGKTLTLHVPDASKSMLPASLQSGVKMVRDE